MFWKQKHNPHKSLHLRYILCIKAQPVAFLKLHVMKLFPMFYNQLLRARFWMNNTYEMLMNVEYPGFYTTL